MGEAKRRKNQGDMKFKKVEALSDIGIKVFWEKIDKKLSKKLYKKKIARIGSSYLFERISEYIIINHIELNSNYKIEEYPQEIRNFLLDMEEGLLKINRKKESK